MSEDRFCQLCGKELAAHVYDGACPPGYESPGYTQPATPTETEAALYRALKNVQMFAYRAKRRGQFEPGDWDHLIRFCADVGVVPSILRASIPEAKDTPRSASGGDTTTRGNAT